MAHHVGATTLDHRTDPHPLRPRTNAPAPFLSTLRFSSRHSNALTGAGVDEGVSWLAEHSESAGRKARK